MTTTPTTSTTSTPSATTAVAATVSKRPLTLTLGAALLLLAALLTFASPFLPRGRGFVGANRPAGTRTAGPGADTGPGGGAIQGQGQDQGGGAIQGPGGTGQANGQDGFGQGNGQGGFGAARTGAGANATLFRFLTPIRITEGVIGGLFTLLAAWGIWKRKKWGMVMALIAAGVMLLTGAVTVILPLLGRAATRAVGPLFAVTTFITGAQWEAIVGIILAVAVAVLVLLPASQKGYIIPPKVRRVM
jgi:hypothetical protein